MDKIQAETIITSAFTALIEKLQQQDSYNSKNVIDDLHTLAKALAQDNTVSLDLHTADQNFELQYKALAEESLESYTQTKESVERINKEQQRVIQRSADGVSLKIDDLMQCFTTIHDQIASQISEANETIKNLTEQVNVLQKTSNLDPLTRTLNRRALDTYMDVILKKRNKISDIYIVLIDIDNFKVVNDSYGHLAGDRVLIFLAKLLSASLRDGDKVFRFGGEEFLIILNRSNEKACERVAKRILESIRENTLLYKEHEIKITLSMGSAGLQEDDSFESFIHRADAALLLAKQNGKDQLVTGK